MLWSTTERSKAVISLPKSHYARRYMSNGMILQWSFRKIARALNKFQLVDSWFLDTRSSSSRYITQWNDFQPTRTLYPKINIQPIRTCLMRAQFRRMTFRHVSFRWTCITLHSVHKRTLNLWNVMENNWTVKGSNFLTQIIRQEDVKTIFSFFIKDIIKYLGKQGKDESEQHCCFSQY